MGMVPTCDVLFDKHAHMLSRSIRLNRAFSTQTGVLLGHNRAFAICTDYVAVWYNIPRLI